MSTASPIDAKTAPARPGAQRVTREPNTLQPAAAPQVEIVHGDEVERPCELLPETAFRGDGQTKADRPALRAMYGAPDDEVGPNSATVRWRFFSCTAGWPDPPGPAEFHEAVRAERPSPRQASVVRAWLQEAPLQEIMLAWIEEAYSWRTLVRAIHRLGHRDPRLNRYLNQFAAPSQAAKQGGPCSS